MAEVNDQRRCAENAEQHHHNPRQDLTALVGHYQACERATVPALPGIPRRSCFLVFSLIFSGFPHSLPFALGPLSQLFLLNLTHDCDLLPGRYCTNSVLCAVNENDLFVHPYITGVTGYTACISTESPWVIARPEHEGLEEPVPVYLVTAEVLATV